MSDATLSPDQEVALKSVTKKLSFDTPLMDGPELSR
jgi:hypothetical protein